MSLQGCSTQCKVRQCSQCQGDTEFCCNTCRDYLCLQCKEKHVNDLDTICHDVIIYREKFKYIPKQETCAKHPDKIYEMFCHSCKFPVCFQCEKHKKHNVLDIRAAYKTNRQQHKEIVHNIRSETLYNSFSLLAEIKTDMKTCHTEISNRQSEMLTKAQRLKDLIDTMIFDVKIRHKTLIHRLQQQKRKMKRNLASIENYEDRSEQSANRPIIFLLFLKKTRVPKIKDTPILTQYALLYLTKRFNTRDVIMCVSNIQTIETRKRQIRNNRLLKLMSTPVLHRTDTVPNVNYIRHITCVTSNLFWISDYKNIILTNTAGDTLHFLADIKQWGYAVHTVNITGDLIYIDRDHNIDKLSKDNKNISILIKERRPWRPDCVYSSPSSGDLLVGMCNTDTKTARVNRYSNTGHHLQKIQHNNKGQNLYSRPLYITENCNGDVIVSDLDHGVVVTQGDGRYRFSYIGSPYGSLLEPRGICTDALSHILVCDFRSQWVHIIDKDGYFLSLIVTQQHGIDKPWSLSYDNKTHLLWVGSWGNDRVCVYRYIERQNYLTENCE
ncbi:uncharacterized protein LOC133194303 [Saccostrea echinata]|uniref:uncharacterized protein LOC133194303 n=1 Tax=Saccostrea echinata TaxID=191078 RepID=UPI002A801990|nr:uncharacterized protein LOC133194303 [Saccostrea echinata]